MLETLSKIQIFFYFLNFLTELCLVQLTELSEILNFWKISSQMCLDFTPQPDKVQNRVAYRWNENFVSFSTVCVTFFYVEYCSHGAQICLSTFFFAHPLHLKILSYSFTYQSWQIFWRRTFELWIIRFALLSSKISE